MFHSAGMLHRALMSGAIVAAAGVAGWYGYQNGKKPEPTVTTSIAATPVARIAVRYRGVSAGEPLPPALLPAFELILDSSYSMQGEVDGQTKSELAHQVTKDLLAALPDSAQVGLRLYGHWGRWLARRDDPEAKRLDNDDPRLNTDSELVVSLGGLTPSRRELLNSWIDWAAPRGKTPLVHSLLEAKKDFPTNWRGARTVIVITDGYETCGGQLEEIAAAYGDPATGIVVHVVGFDIDGSRTHDKLAEIARSAGGNYYRADGAAELAVALRQAVHSPAFVVYDSAGEQIVARGPINSEPLDLHPGTYRVAVQGFESQAVEVEVHDGTTLALSLDGQGNLAQP